MDALVARDLLDEAEREGVAGVVAHEVRSPVSFVRTALDVIETRAESGDVNGALSLVADCRNQCDFTLNLSSALLEYAKAGEFVYDHPFLWGSKRTGPDLLRVGGKYSDNWHLNHMYDPQSTSSGSIMPAYQWLVRNEHDRSEIQAKMRTMATLGVPYSEEDIEGALASMDAQATQIEKNLYTDPEFARSYEEEKNFARENGQDFIQMRDREIVALIAYLQRLGTDIKIEQSSEVVSENP